MMFKLESPEFPGGMTGDGGGGDMWHSWSTIKKKNGLFQVEAGHIFVLEYTEGE